MKFSYRIEQDESHGDSPRDWENLGTMVCWHRNYNLGDEQPDHSVGVWLHGMLCEFDLERCNKDGYYTQHWEDFVYDLENDDPIATGKAWDMLLDKIVVLPLYIYDHSGISMSTSYTYPYNDRWDAGQVGFIYISHDDIRSEYSWKYLTAKRLDKIRGYLRNEIETYNQYLTGDVWGYIVEDEDGDHIDSCWGFYGRDYCETEAKESLDRQIKEHASLNEFERVA